MKPFLLLVGDQNSCVAQVGSPLAELSLGSSWPVSKGKVSIWYPLQTTPQSKHCNLIQDARLAMSTLWHSALLISIPCSHFPQG